MKELEHVGASSLPSLANYSMMHKLNKLKFRCEKLAMVKTAKGKEAILSQTI